MSKRSASVANFGVSQTEELFEYAQTAERAVVTYNRDDFLELDRRYRGQDRSHSGIVILNPDAFPRATHRSDLS